MILFLQPFRIYKNLQNVTHPIAMATLMELSGLSIVMTQSRFTSWSNCFYYHTVPEDLESMVIRLKSAD